MHISYHVPVDGTQHHGFRCIKLALNDKTTLEMFSGAFAAAAAGMGLHSPAVLWIDTSQLPLALLRHAPSFHKVYKANHESLKRTFRHSIVTIQSPLVKDAINLVLSLVPEPATIIHTVGSDEEARRVLGEIQAAGIDGNVDTTNNV